MGWPNTSHLQDIGKPTLRPMTGLLRLSFAQTDIPSASFLASLCHRVIFLRPTTPRISGTVFKSVSYLTVPNVSIGSKADADSIGATVPLWARSGHQATSCDPRSWLRKKYLTQALLRSRAFLCRSSSTQIHNLTLHQIAD